jgi:eukaryotic-like serine/threonine-protein kinase
VRSAPDGLDQEAYTGDAGSRLLLMNERAAPQAASPTAITGRSSARPFVGRVQELAGLASALEEAASGRGSLVLLTGEPGIGKTRLMSELARLAGQRGARVVTGRCWEEGGAPPYWPWMQVVRSVGGDLERLAASAAPHSGPRGPAPESERVRMFDAVGRFLAAASSEQPLFVTLDDVHAADEPSLLLLRFLGDALAEARVVLVASYREGEKRVRELGDVFAELARVGRRIPLRGLTSEDIEAYVATVTGSRPTRQVVARLHEVTAGNPFFVGEIVRLLVAEGSVESLEESARDPLRRLPEEVRVLIRRRVAGLSREAVAALRVAAVLGREFDLHLLQRTSGLTPARLLAVLREAAAVGVVAELPSTARRCTFEHELMRETLYEDLPPARRLELHHEVGRLLESAYGDDLDPHLSEIARHLYLAAPLGDAGQALEYLVRAGDRASAVFAYEEAAVHYRRALELLALAGEASGEWRVELLLRLGDAQWRSGDGGEARMTFEDAIEGARRLGKGELLARAALGYVTALGGFLLYARFEVGGTGVGLLEEALAALPPGDSSLRTHLLAHLALEMWSGNEPVERRVAVSQEAIEMARRIDDSEALVTALHSRHWALTTPGMVLERLAHTEEMLRVAKATANAEIEFLAHNARFHCFLELCDRRGMDAESEAMKELAERLRQPFYRWHTVCLRTLRATLDGRLRDAEHLAEEALDLGRLRQSEYATYVFRYAQMLAIRWAQGRLRELWPEIEDHAERFPWIPRWREALAAAELADEQMALRELERHAAHDFADLPRDGLWLLHMCALSDSCVLVGDERRALQLYELLLPHADDNAVSYTQQPFGPVALRLGKLAALVGRWKETDRHFGRALACCELLGAPAIRTRVLFEHASALAAHGEPADRGRLNAMLEEVANLCDELGLSGLFGRVAALRERPAPQPAGDTVFRREGEFWTIMYEGRTFRLRDVKGLRYIASLLGSPGREVHVLELVSAVTGGPIGPRPPPAGSDLVGSWPSDLASPLDERAKTEYRRRLEDLEEELVEARDFGDTERATRIEEEIDFLTRELAQALGLGGRDRTVASPAERARISVTKAIRTAIKLVDKQCPALAAHLEASIHTGRFCSYAPPGAAPPRWAL